MQLSAYHDGELDLAARGEVESHLLQCPRCQRQLEEIRQITGLFEADSADATEERSRRRFHQAIEREKDRPLLRIGAAVATIAASIMIIGLAWLRELPTAPAGSAVPSIVLHNTTRAEDWQRLARTLRAEPRFRAGPGSDVELAQMRITDYMVLDLGQESH